MIFIKKPAPDDAMWARSMADDETRAYWEETLRQAKAKGDDLVANYDDKIEVEIDASLYKRYMHYLLALFNGKCAYCETNIRSNQPGDVEHYRPKGRVVDDDFRPVRVNHPKRGEIDHPGYFWLAYEWGNLFPSCIDCNRYRRHGKEKNSGAGKADRFPVDGAHAGSPLAVVGEKALLVNPSEVNPSEHLRFLSDGKIEAKTNMGEATLKLLGLNRREGLVEQRKAAYEETDELFQGCMMSIFARAPDAKRKKERLNDMWLGRSPYSAVRRRAIEDSVERIATEHRVGVVMPFELSQ